LSKIGGILNLAKFADKKFGQNFLQSSVVIDKIIQAMPSDTLRVVEIGPGLGDLTKELIKDKFVVAYEVDTRLCEHLNSHFKDAINSGRLEVKCGDVLTHWQEGSLYKEEYNLVANLPYYIATNIILKALGDIKCKSILVMVQKEVAQKFSAHIEQKEFSALSVITQRVADATLLFDVDAKEFVPPPKVTSSILYIDKRDNHNDKGFEEFLKVAFSQPRKKLLSNLANRYPKSQIERLFEQEGLNPNARPHQVSTSSYHRIYIATKKDTDGREYRE